MKTPIYLDNHATTKIDERVLDSIMPFLTENYGNPSSKDNLYGNIAISAIHKSREKVAIAINASSDEIIFTSGATESDNLAIVGVAKKLKERGNHIITTKVEHKAILDSCEKLSEEGFEITYLNVDINGNINIEDLKSEIKKDTILISIMAANNEIGTIFPLKEIGKIAKENNILFHSDATQAVGYIDIDVEEMNLDLISLSGHKIHGPKGVGVLFVKRGLILSPITFGGGQERNIRSGTLNVPGIVGIGRSMEIAKKDMKNNYEKVKNMRDFLYNSIRSKIDIEVNGSMENRLPGNLSIFIEGINSKALMSLTKNEIAISAGSACNSEDITPSHVILALGHDKDRAYSTIRIGISKFNTIEEMKKTAEVLLSAIKKLKMFS